MRKEALPATLRRAGRALQLVARVVLLPRLAARLLRRAEQLPLQAQRLPREAPLPLVAAQRKQVPAAVRLASVARSLAALVVDKAARSLAALVVDKAARSLAALVVDKVARSLAMLVEPPQVVPSPTPALLEHLRQSPIVQIILTMATRATIAPSDTSVEQLVAILPIVKFALARSSCPRVLRAAQTSSSAGIAFQSILAPRVLQVPQEAANHALN